MSNIDQILQNNKTWAQGVISKEPDFFQELAKGQSPKYLWIGCSDSRVPASQVCGLGPGEAFVHRNIANLVQEGDTSCQSVIQYAVSVLKVSDIVICGHSNCGGVQASISGGVTGPVADWIKPIEKLFQSNSAKFSPLSDEDKTKLLIQLNVEAQMKAVSKTKPVQEAWSEGRKLSIHGLIYHLETGTFQKLGTSVD